MKWSSALVIASCGLVAAHGDLPIPKLFGARRFLSMMKAGHNPLSPELPEHSALSKRTKGDPEKRQDNTEDRCGEEAGSCAAGYCCSAEGWCGKGTDYCTAPDCLINYGPGCDANQRPTGRDTSAVPRPPLGDVRISGAGIYDCVNAGEIALTFDDGPYLYTSDLLDKFASYGAKATFFITGNNLGKGMINDPSTPYPDIIKRMHNEGHQIASHTWSHQNASQLSNNQFANQIIWNEIAFNSILGFFPTYMRPPYSICEKTCQDILRVLGYHIIYFDLDTEGYLKDDPNLIQGSKDIWDKAIHKADSDVDSFLQIEHDIHKQSVYNLTDYFLTSLLKYGYKSVTVGQCLGDPADNWYRAGPGAATPSSSGPTSAPPSSTTTIAADTPIHPTTTRTTTSTPLISDTPIGSKTDSPISSSTRTSTQAPTPTSTQPAVSRNGRCGAESGGETCTGSFFGACCNASGRCVDTLLGCLELLGCQRRYGVCT